jgi:hypothetical protein
MLVPNQEGLLVGKKQQMLDGVIPSAQEYGSAPVYRERTATLKPTGGYGERVQSSFADRRYYWGVDIQVSGGLFGKGPLLHPIVPTTAPGGTGGVRKLIDAPNAAGTGRDQLILSGFKVYRRTDDTNAGQVVARDGVTVAPVDGAVFQGGYAGATPCAYIAWSDGTLFERTAANVWTACALPATFLAYRLEVVGTELWAADTVNSVLRKVTADPKVAGSWSGPFFVGDPSVKISAIRSTSNVLVVFKEDGSIFTLNSDGSTNDLFPGLTSPVNPDNGLRAQAWMNALYFRAGPSFYSLEMPGANLTPAGPGKMLDNASPVRGEPRVLAGWGGYQAYLGLWNETDNISYLLSYGSWEPRVSEQGTAFVFDDQYDGALAHWAGRKITALSVSGASGTDRLYIGFEDGGWDWFKLVRNPLATGSGAEFCLGPSDMIFPLHHTMFQADLKHWLGFSLFGPVMRIGDEATLYYRIMASAGAPPTDPTGDWLLLGEFTQNGQRIETPPNLAGNAIQLKLSLTNDTTATTPVIETLAVHERVVPAFKRDLSGTVDARNYVSRLDGAVQRLDSERIHQLMMDAGALPGSMAIELPDETVNEIAFFGYQERLLPPAAGGGHGWGIDFQATQFRVLTIYGTIGRLRGSRIGDLRGYPISSLRTL